MNRKIIKLIFLLILILGGVIFVKNLYNSTGLDVKEEKILKHGFRLLEEQIATYIKENYSGVSKIEFSPILIQGGGFSSPFTADVLPVIYDEEGNRAVLGTKIGNHVYPSYGTTGDLFIAFDSSETEIIILKKSSSGLKEEVDVSNQNKLPEKAKIKTDLKGTDRNIKALVDDGQLKNVEKNEKGSPDAEITYNLEIKRGSYSKWN